MPNIHDIIKAINREGFLVGWIRTALYPCAGIDTMVFTYTHPDFYIHRGIRGVPSPNVFVCVGDQDPFDRDDPALRLNDGRTRIFTATSKPIELDDKQGYRFDVVWQSFDPPKWMTLRERHLTVLQVIADWRWFSEYLGRVGWVPDTFIGVRDGCSYDSNTDCVNDLTSHSLPVTALRSAPIFQFYITDHFENAWHVSNLRDGDTVHSKDERYPYRFKKRALLTPDWSVSGRDGELRGATLFELEKKETILLRLAWATDTEKKEICKALGIDYTTGRYKISKEYRAAAGHSLANLFRDDHELPYKTILIDVADKLCPDGWTDHSLEDQSTEVEIEEEIMKYVNRRVEDDLKKLSPAEREKKAEEFRRRLEEMGYDQAVIGNITSAIASGVVGAALATPIAVSVFYSGVMASLWASIFGPSMFYLTLSATGVGLLVAVPLFALTLGTPAYRKTIPATIQMIMIRKRMEAEKMLCCVRQP
ncbi:MAG: hypothetical protein V2B18_03515 [Pseudomonadota bacterium]